MLRRSLNCRVAGATQHDDSEYGEQRTEDGAHCGGPFWINVSLKMRVEDVRHVIRVRRWEQLHQQMVLGT